MERRESTADLKISLRAIVSSHRGSWHEQKTRVALITLTNVSVTHFLQNARLDVA